MKGGLTPYTEETDQAGESESVEVLQMKAPSSYPQRGDLLHRGRSAMEMAYVQDTSIRSGDAFVLREGHHLVFDAVHILHKPGISLHLACFVKGEIDRNVMDNSARICLHDIDVRPQVHCFRNIMRYENDGCRGSDVPQPEGPSKQMNWP